MSGNVIADVALYAVPLLFGVVAHEVAHGWVAEKCGDPTARLNGRLTLNPFVHIDLIGTVIVPLLLIVSRSPFLFGWAKPVPVNYANLRGGRRDMALVALAGPLTNLLMVVVSAFVYNFILQGFHRGWWDEGSGLLWLLEPLFRMAYYSVRFNLMLTLFNLIPIPPLDGGHVLMGVLPYRWAYQMERLEKFGFLIVLLLLWTGAWGTVMGPIFSALLRFFLK